MAKLKYAALGFLVILPALVIGIIGMIRTTPVDPPGPTGVASSSPALTPPPVEPERTHQDGFDIDESRVAALEDAVYRFDEAYRSPPSAERTSILASLTTPEGLRSLGDLSGGSSLAEQSAKGFKIEVIRAPNSVNPEPFDSDNVSVYSKIKANRSRDGIALTPTTAEHVTSWIWDPSTKQWRLAAFTPPRR